MYISFWHGKCIKTSSNTFCEILITADSHTYLINIWISIFIFLILFKENDITTTQSQREVCSTVWNFYTFYFVHLLQLRISLRWLIELRRPANELVFLYLEKLRIESSVVNWAGSGIVRQRQKISRAKLGSGKDGDVRMTLSWGYRMTLEQNGITIFWEDLKWCLT